MELDGRYALVTGAGSGIGKAAAIKLAQAGARLALVGRTVDELEETADIINGNGRKPLVLGADVAVEDEMRAAFEQVRTRFGKLDFAFANAGINGLWAPIEEFPYEEWNRTQSINLGGTFLTVRHAIPLMRANGGGSIAITSSINGTRTFTTAGAACYSASKAAQFAFGQQAAVELGRYRIRVNVICPGAISTNIGSSTRRENTDSIKWPAEFPQGSIPLTGKAPGTPEDVADAVVFLASDRSRHISGTPIWIDGAQGLIL
jgi:NAD(P)-dependent dehydrogenase (short-subunit alcohol dehydrogenase family)